MFHLHRWSVRNRKPELSTYSEPSLDIHSLCSGFTDAFAMFSFDRDSTKCSVLCSGRGYSEMANFSKHWDQIGQEGDCSSTSCTSTSTKNHLMQRKTSVCSQGGWSCSFNAIPIGNVKHTLYAFPHRFRPFQSSLV